MLISSENNSKKLQELAIKEATRIARNSSTSPEYSETSKRPVGTSLVRRHTITTMPISAACLVEKTSVNEINRKIKTTGCQTPCDSPSKYIDTKAYVGSFTTPTNSRTSTPLRRAETVYKKHTYIPPDEESTKPFQNGKSLTSVGSTPVKVKNNFNTDFYRLCSDTFYDNSENNFNNNFNGSTNSIFFKLKQQLEPEHLDDLQSNATNHVSNLFDKWLINSKVFLLEIKFSNCYNTNLQNQLKLKTKSINHYETAVKDLINRIIGNYHDVNDFIVIIDQSLHPNHLDTFELEMVENDEKLLIKANSGIAATWGFNYYLKYYTNSSVFWSGKNINLNNSNLPIVSQKVRITSKDYVRFYQNIVTYSYSYVWWDWNRWEYEIDWMALNGINMVYAQTAAEYPWLKVLSDLGFKQEEIDNFFPGPAYLAWSRMGNLKKFAGPLPQSWHQDQLNLQLKIIKRYNELGIKYVLPSFSGFVPDQITRLFPYGNFTKAEDWHGFNCTFSCLMMIDPLDPLFIKIGSAYNKEVIRLFGASGFYSADVFNEMIPKSSDLEYLAVVNQAVYESLRIADEKAIWVMQGWLFNDAFWNSERVKAFLSRIPLGNLIILDLYSEYIPHYEQFESYFGHNFVWNMLHNFGGANSIFGDIDQINILPDIARALPNNSMVGIGITMEGINQNEIIYDFMLEKTWRSSLNECEFSDWILKYTHRRYSNSNISSIDSQFNYQYKNFVKLVYNHNDHSKNRQLFAKRPSINLNGETFTNVKDFYKYWHYFVEISHQFKSSALFKYDLVDISKEALRWMFSYLYPELINEWKESDLYKFGEVSSKMIEILEDMEKLLGSDEHYLLGKWLNMAKLKGHDLNEKNLYEFNARSQITLWGTNKTSMVFDYAAKAWSGLIEDYYIPRWKIFFKAVEKSIIRGKPIDVEELVESLLVDAELAFIFSKKEYPTRPIGDSFEIIKKIHSKYGL
ncbi:unnamed protein product [Brachionus calyciflorus]|uniref:Alpha-N-acetylglucosaminidase n=1 Tax=Brachionus calyciflorus TaxID=104777 RepID=A0A814IEF2_9BILA|nr:unnamed protein product [Brachionus calyciflorus]